MNLSLRFDTRLFQRCHRVIKRIDTKTNVFYRTDAAGLLFLLSAMAQLLSGARASARCVRQ